MLVSVICQISLLNVYVSHALLNHYCAKLLILCILSYEGISPIAVIFGTDYFAYANENYLCHLVLE